MHPVLQVEVLDQLPLSTRMVTPMLCPYPSYPTLRQFLCFQKVINETPIRSLPTFLPIFYHLLDPRRIPTEEEFEEEDDDPDSWPEGRKFTVTVMQICLKSVWACHPTPSAAIVDLWPRVWAWTNFYSTYGYRIRRKIGVPQPWLLHLHFMEICAHWSNQPSNMEMIASTPGYGIVVMRGVAAKMQSIWMICLPGIDGDLDDLARLIMRLLQFVVPLNATRPNSVPGWIMTTALNIVTIADDIDGQRVTLKEDEAMHNPLCFALIPLGIVKTLMTVARRCSSPNSSPESDKYGIIKQCLRFLQPLFQGPRGDRVLRIAVENGLLNVTVECMRWEGESFQKDLWLLLDILRSATVHYHLLIALRFAFSELERTPARHDCSESYVFQAWTNLVESFDARAQILELFEAKTVSQRACDNLQCEIVNAKRSLRRCSGCWSVLYCSQRCQTEDWRAGHRDFCSMSLAYRTNIHLTYKSKEYAFLRFLLHRYYEAEKSAISASFVREWAVINKNVKEGSPQQEVATVYDFRYFPPQIKCSLMSDYLNATRLGNEAGNSRHVMDRVSRSAGRLTFDLMRVYEGGYERDILLPFRRTNSKLPDALKNIASRAESLSPEETQEQIDSAIKRESRITG
ncbi:hypothetical protein R3P38DRAFT_2843972 [Favolaschia claudopus]|uniref:MYND-type domain-containing protein n=1 Tax=Favolaschia claudopus TaxID=2862362 RepID=A0AAW0E2F9_9AGAR